MPFNFSMPKMPSFSMPKFSGGVSTQSPSPGMNPNAGGIKPTPSLMSRIGTGLSSAAEKAATGIQSAVNSPAASNLMSGLSQVGSAMLPALAPQIGQAIGNKIGGNAGQMVNQLGQAFGGYGQPQESQYGPQRSVQDYIQQGNQMGQEAINQGQQMFGNSANNAINQYIPQQMQGMNFGNMGAGLGGMASDFLNRYLPQGQNGQPGLGDILGGMAGGYLNQGIQRFIPQQFHGANFGNIGGYAAQQGANMANRGLNYATDYAMNQANRYMPYNPQYGQAF